MVNLRENKTIGIIAGVVFLLSIILIFIVSQPKKIETTLMSESTGEIFSMKVAQGAKFPINHPKTGIKDLYPASKVKCTKCGWEGYVIKKPQQILTKEEVRAGKEGGEVRPRCPKCGSPI
jgi:hypothetical protein